MKGKIIEMKIVSDNVDIELGTDEEKYKWSYPALKAFPIILNVVCKKNELRKDIRFCYKLI